MTAGTDSLPRNTVWQSNQELGQQARFGNGHRIEITRNQTKPFAFVVMGCQRLSVGWLKPGTTQALIMSGLVVWMSPVVSNERDGARTRNHRIDSTEVAHEGPEALTGAERFNPDVILLGIGLPSLSGYDACRQIRKKSPDVGPVIVALTGWGMEQDRHRSADAGFNQHLVKPVRYEPLRALLDCSDGESPGEWPA